jgi:hypothetical protein
MSNEEKLIDEFNRMAEAMAGNTVVPLSPDARGTVAATLLLVAAIRESNPRQIGREGDNA